MYATPRGIKRRQTADSVTGGGRKLRGRTKELDDRDAEKYRRQPKGKGLLERLKQFIERKRTRQTAL